MLFKFNNNEYRLILFTLSGSRFYGTYYDKNDPDRIHPLKPNYCSDHDYRGIFISNPDTKIGLIGHIDEIEVKTDKNGDTSEQNKALIDQLNTKLNLNMAYDTDLTLYEIKKFITLANENNPNIFDILFADNEAIQYSDEKGKKLLNENKEIFISTKTKFTFSGYAVSQLHRISGHNKWINKYPKTNIVINELKKGFDNGEIDYNWITDFFGGRVSEFVTGIPQQEANNLENMVSISWSEFINRHSEKAESEDVMTITDWEVYRKPQLVDYCKLKDLNAKKLSLDSFVPMVYKELTIRRFLIESASFRTISKTQYNIFMPPNNKYNGGIFSRNGMLKVKDPKEVGTFCFHMSIDHSAYLKDLDDIQKLWTWKTGRNEKRSVLEEHFGYDVKHGSHCFRLLIGGKNILATGEYKPRLSGDDLKLVRSILNGEKTYDWVIEHSEKLLKDLDVAYNNSKLPKTPNHKKSNELLLELSREL